MVLICFCQLLSLGFILIVSCVCYLEIILIHRSVFQMYRGLVNDGYKHPEYLATQDVVICSFETLRQEVYFVEARPRLGAPMFIFSAQFLNLCE